MDDQPTKKPVFGMADAFVLALVTATTYLCGYAFEKHFCLHFTIPTEVIRLSTENLIVSFLSLISFVSSVIFLINSVIYLGPRLEIRKNVFWLLALTVSAPILLVSFFIAQAEGYSRTGFQWALGMSVGFPLMILAVAVLGTFLDSLITRFTNRKLIEPYIEKRKEDPIDWTIKRMDRSHVIAMVSIWVLYLLAGAAGSRTARFKRSFLYYETSRLLVIRRYNDTFVCKRLNATSTGFEPGFTLIPLDELKAQHLALFDFKSEPIVEQSVPSTSPSPPPVSSPPSTSLPASKASPSGTP